LNFLRAIPPPDIFQSNSGKKLSFITKALASIFYFGDDSLFVGFEIGFVHKQPKAFRFLTFDAAAVMGFLM